MRVGVLALQGAFVEHQSMLNPLGVETVLVRTADQLEGLDSLIIPGGESTTIGKMAVAYDLMAPLQAFGRSKPVWGSCAGAIFLSKDANREQPLLGLMDISVERNAFGRQLESFEIDLMIPALQMESEEYLPFHSIFIRAPLIETVGPEVDVVAALPDGRIVAARQGKLLATSFHPELTNDDRFHRYFLKLSQID